MNTEEVSDDIKLKQAILSVLANVLNYPTDVQPLLLGVSVANLAEKTFRAVKESGLVDEREYEYAVQRTLVGPGASMIVGDHWSSLDEVNKGLLNLSTERIDYTLVKRRKAGEVEDA